MTPDLARMEANLLGRAGHAIDFPCECCGNLKVLVAHCRRLEAVVEAARKVRKKAQSVHLSTTTGEFKELCDKLTTLDPTP